MLPLSILLTLVPCADIGRGNFVCPADIDSQLEAGDDPVTIHVFDPDARSGDGWECTADWCTFDFGLASEDDTLPAPGQSGCEGDDGSGSGTRTIWVKTKNPNVTPTPPCDSCD